MHLGVDHLQRLLILLQGHHLLREQTVLPPPGAVLAALAVLLAQLGSRVLQVRRCCMSLRTGQTQHKPGAARRLRHAQLGLPLLQAGKP